MWYEDTALADLYVYLESLEIFPKICDTLWQFEIIIQWKFCSAVGHMARR